MYKLLIAFIFFTLVIITFAKPVWYCIEPPNSGFAELRHAEADCFVIQEEDSINSSEERFLQQHEVTSEEESFQQNEIISEEIFLEKQDLSYDKHNEIKFTKILRQ